MRLFHSKYPTADEVRLFEDLMNNAERLTGIRNDYLHVAWSETTDGKPIRKTLDHRWEPAPSPQVEEVTNQIIVLTNALNDARKDGFIADVVTPQP